MAEIPEKYESWAIVELMGHLTVVGHCFEETRFGVVMLRVDVPEITKIQEWTDYDSVRDPVTGAYSKKRQSITTPAHTRYFGGASIYSFTPCSEEVARKVAEKDGSARPPGVLEIKRALPPGPANPPADETLDHEYVCDVCCSYPCACNRHNPPLDTSAGMSAANEPEPSSPPEAPQRCFICNQFGCLRHTIDTDDQSA